ncbi:S8 family serine peptidase [Streptomyces sp. B15]|uniref:S8 family serine peptidase n=1 Tax=Streptomyces sp. B15 TaxID=1537797 RepID=UPI001FFD3C19|nr:S8 family serine peptidase [Streptomyces sp. B15]
MGAWAVSFTVLAPVAGADSVQSQQWYLKPMQAEKMWKVATGEGIKVAVVDTGVDSSTPSLRGRVLPGKDVSGAPGDEMRDDAGHGTTMAEIIAGSGKGGALKGLAPDAKIIPIKGNLKGVPEATKDASGAKAIRAAADSDAQIINMSFGGAPHPAFKKALDYATKKGKLLLAGTGNDAKKGNQENYPAAYPNVAAVASIDKTGRVAESSTYGEQTDLSGPGEGVPVLCDGKKQAYCPRGGTSAATAIASASAALIWSHHPDWTANQVLRVLLKTGDLADKPSIYVGHGAVRPRMNLLEGKGDPGDPDISPLTGERTLNTKSKESGSDAKNSGKGSGKDDSNKEAAPDKVKVADSKAEDDGGSWLLPAIGIAAGVIILGGCGFAVVRIRRN